MPAAPLKSTSFPPPLSFPVAEFSLLSKHATGQAPTQKQFIL